MSDSPSSVLSATETQLPTGTAAPPATAPVPEATLDALHPSEAAGFNPSLDAWLRPEAAVSVADDLPLLCGTAARSRRLVVRRGGRPVSHAALYVHRYRLPGVVLRVGIVGAVATAPEERGRGHAGRILRALDMEARTQGLDLLVLWTDIQGWYERFGYVRAGLELVFAAGKEALRGAARVSRVRRLQPADREAVVALHGTELAGTCREPSAWAAFWGLPRTEWFVLEGHRGITAYGVVGKGADLQGCLHEWSGPEEALPALVAGILELRGDDQLYVMAAPWKARAARAMAARGLPALVGVLGMIRVVDPETLCQRLAREDLAASVGTAPEALVPALFGPSDEGPAVPFYLAGLDSM